MMFEGAFGEAGAEFVIEEFLARPDEAVTLIFAREYARAQQTRNRTQLEIVDNRRARHLYANVPSMDVREAGRPSGVNTQSRISQKSIKRTLKR
ncbi:hypothetical protein G8O24_42025 [Bradyrhizobium sp. INPA01-394B]|nr:hypothetical protein [Bradyrhizobium campsiandrae]